jgi:hypothetical protein
MNEDASRTAILISSLVLLAVSGILIIAEGKDTNQEASESLPLMNAQDQLGTADSINEHINYSKAELIAFAKYPLDPRGSNRLQSDDRALNESAYLDLMNLVMAQYLEDLNYSSYVLDGFVNKKIDSKQAMTTTMTLFVLTSETVDMVDQIRPPDNFMEYHNVAQLTLINFEGYLWNMIKFYETNRKDYALQAHDNFNESMIYNRELKNTSSIVKYNIMP